MKYLVPALRDAKNIDAYILISVGMANMGSPFYMGSLDAHPELRRDRLLSLHHRAVYTKAFMKLLGEPKLVSWFVTQHSPSPEWVSHPKLEFIPLGMDLNALKVRKSYMASNPSFPRERKTLLYVNFDAHQLPGRATDLDAVQRQFDTKLHNHYDNLVSQGKLMSLRDKYKRKYQKSLLYQHFSDLAESKFVMSPKGFGFDCHRTYDSIAMGAIPIVMGNPYFRLMFQDLPVLLIQNWSTIGPTFLREQYALLQARSYDWKRLSSSFWLERFRSIQTNFALQRGVSRPSLSSSQSHSISTTNATAPLASAVRGGAQYSKLGDLNDPGSLGD